MTFEGDIVTPDELQNTGDLQDDYMVLVSKPDSSQLFNVTVGELKEALGIPVIGNWISATISKNFVPFSDGQEPEYRKYGNRVYVRGVVKPTQAISAGNTEIEIFTLPEGFRPVKKFYQLSPGSIKNNWLLTVSTKGVVALSKYGLSAYAECPTSAWLAFNAEFYLD